jgi:hypothetical protein
MKIYPPSENLGCLGFRLTENLYFDFYKSPHWGFFMNFRGRKLWVHGNGFKYEGYKMVLFRLKTPFWGTGLKHLIIRNY